MTIHGTISINQPASTVSAIDATDWAANGITLGTDTVNLYFRLRITTSLGTTTLYDNLSGPTPDIIVVSAGQQAQLLNMIPTGQDSDIVQGTYELTIRAEGSGPAIDSFDELGYESYTLNYTWPEVCIKTGVFCDKSQVQSDDISDYGIYATNISRSHTLYPPPASGAPSQVTPLPVNVYGPNIWSKTWTAQIISVVTFTFADNFVVYKQLDNAKEFEVVCSREICSVMCCVTKMFRKYEVMWGRQGTGDGKDYFSRVVIPGMMHAMAFLLHQNCGRTQAAAAEVALLKQITGCGECDECGDDEPLIILPTVGSGNLQVVVDSPLGTVTVTPEVISNVQYFHLEVSAAIQQIINQFKAITMSSDNLALLRVAPYIDSVDGHINWVLSPQTAGLIKNQISYRVKIYANPSPAIGQPEFLLSNVLVKVNGDKVQEPTFGLGNTTPNTLTDYAVMDVSDFFAGQLTDPPTVDPETPYELHAQVMRSTDDKDNFTLVDDIECRILWFDTAAPNFRVQLYSPVDGQPLLLSDLSAKDDIYLAIRINVHDD